MEWTLLALASASTFAVVTVLDKRLISTNLPSLYSYYAWTGVGRLLWGVLVLGIAGISLGDSGSHVLVAVLAGLGWAGALALMSLGYHLEEASGVTAVSHTYPVVSALLAVTVLDEALVPGQWVAIVAVVAGAFLVSVRGSPVRGLPRLNVSFPVLVGSSLCFGLAFFGAKYALEEVSVWTMFSIRQLCMAAVFVVLAGKAGWREVPRVARDHNTLVLMLVAEFLLAHIATIFMLLATERGPVSLVATLSGTRPLFVFLYTITLSASWWRVLDEPLERAVLAQKAASIAIIVAGIVVLRTL